MATPRLQKPIDVDDEFEIIDTPTVEGRVMDSDGAFELLASLMLKQGKVAKGPIFHVSSDNQDRDHLWKLFIAKLSILGQQEMNCHTCKHFMRQYGDLCIVEDDGNLIPISWPFETDQVPAYYKEAVQNVAGWFVGKEVGDEFILQKDQSRTLGKPLTGKFNHMSVILEDVRSANAIKSMDSQDTETSYTMLARTLSDNTTQVIQRTHHLIHDNQLPYATAHRAPIDYLKNTAAKVECIKDPVKRKNLITRYAREAFTGCLSSLRGGMVGFLLECVAGNMEFEKIKELWMAKADPLTYLRPTAAPSVGNIGSAEKIFAQLGYTPRDLERVYLTLDQVPQQSILWSPVPNDSNQKSDASQNADPAPAKLFSSLLPKNPKPSVVDYTQAPIKDISFRQFASKVLPTAKKIELLPAKMIRPYFFTSGKEGSKPIMSFHKDGGHTASWYTFATAREASCASLKTKWTPVKAVVTFPHMWDNFDKPIDALDSEKAEAFKHKRHGIRYLFCLEGARESWDQMNLCLFPTLMKGEFHSVRKTVEAFSSKGRIEIPQDAGGIVGGLAVEGDRAEALTVAVVTKEGQISRYKITLFE